MSPANPHSTCGPLFEVRFRSLGQGGQVECFPCDAQGHVELDALSERARLAYIHARALVGREYALPSVAVIDLP